MNAFYGNLESLINNRDTIWRAFMIKRTFDSKSPLPFVPYNIEIPNVSNLIQDLIHDSKTIYENKTIEAYNALSHKEAIDALPFNDPKIAPFSECFFDVLINSEETFSKDIKGIFGYIFSGVLSNEDNSVSRCAIVRLTTPLKTFKFAFNLMKDNTFKEVGSSFYHFHPAFDMVVIDDTCYLVNDRALGFVNIDRYNQQCFVKVCNLLKASPHIANFQIPTGRRPYARYVAIHDYLNEDDINNRLREIIQLGKNPPTNHELFANLNIQNEKIDCSLPDSFRSMRDLLSYSAAIDGNKLVLGNVREILQLHNE